jgi:hypothetical protein
MKEESAYRETPPSESQTNAMVAHLAAGKRKKVEGERGIE